MYKFLERFGPRIEELILVLLIALNVLDFLEIIPADLDYIKKVISWVVLGYIVYKIDLTKVFFGASHRNVDILLILSYFLLIIKNFTAFAMASIHQSNYLHAFYDFVITNASVIELWGFYIGGISIILIALYYAIRFPVKAPSVMHVIHEEGQPPKHLGKLAIRFLTIFLVLISFFVIVFNLMMEWLAIAIDAPLVIAAIFFYLFHMKRFKTHTLIYKLGTVGEKFYARFIGLFKYRHTLMLGVAGMLVLHLLTDIGNFIIPYTFVLRDQLYFSQLGPGHTPLPLLFFQSMLPYSFMTRVGLEFVYLLNISAAVMLLVFPAYFWYDSYIRKRIGFSRRVLAFFAMSITALLLKPAFMIKGLSSSSLVGVDILTRTIEVSNLWPVIMISLIMGAVVYVLSSHIKRELELGGMVISLTFFAYYMFNFFANLFSYYVISVVTLLKESSHFFIALFLFLFFGITIAFYVGGFLIFVVESVKSYFSF